MEQVRKKEKFDWEWEEPLVHGSGWTLPRALTTLAVRLCALVAMLAMADCVEAGVAQRAPRVVATDLS